MNNLEGILSHIEESSSFIGVGKDKEDNSYSYWNYSTTIQMLPSWEQVIKTKFPTFSIYHIYSNYYLIGFNKSS